MATLAEIMDRKAAAQAGSAIRIRSVDEKPKLAAQIKQSLDATAPKPLPPAPEDTRRELGATEVGERIPVNHPEQGAENKAWDWFDSSHSFDTDLGIVIEPNGEFAWIAVQAKNPKFNPPLLLHRLPLLNRPSRPENPF